MLIKFTLQEYPEGWLAIGYCADHVICAIHGVIAQYYFSKIFPPENPFFFKVSVGFSFLSLFLFEKEKRCNKDIFKKIIEKPKTKKRPQFFVESIYFF